MRLTKRWLASLGAAVAVAVVGAAAALDWWHVALTVLAATQVAVVVLVLDVRARMARSPDLRNVAASVATVQRRVDNVGTRMLAVAETSRLEVVDRLTEIARVLDENRGAQTSRHTRQTEALIQLYNRVRPRASMPSSGGWALDPTGILTLLELLDRRRPRLVLELGSGTSTLWLAYALEELGAGRIVTVEHAEQYAEGTRENLRAHGLDEIVEVRLAPLVKSGLPGHTTLWYDHSVMADLTGVDLLVVDGPPRGTGPLARYPAMPKLAGQLTDTAVVALDDATRPDEREVVRRWCAENPGLRVWPVPPGDALQVLVRELSHGEQAG